MLGLNSLLYFLSLPYNIFLSYLPKFLHFCISISLFIFSFSKISKLPKLCISSFPFYFLIIIISLKRKGKYFSDECSKLRLIERKSFVMPETSKQAQTQARFIKRPNVVNLGNFVTNGVSASGAAFLSVILVTPLDVAKTRLQAQAAGIPYAHPLSNEMSRMTFCGPNMIFADLRCSPRCSRAGIQGTAAICPPDCFHYHGTLDVLFKVSRQEGVTRLWRGTSAGLALAYPWPVASGALARSLACVTCYPIDLARTRMQAFKHNGKNPSGIWKTLVEVVSNTNGTNTSHTKLSSYRVLWTGLGAQLARYVPYSAICWATLEPLRQKLRAAMGNEPSALTTLGSNSGAGFVAGCLAAGVTCPLDVARTRRQIEKDPVKAMRMSTRKTLVEIWRDGGIRGLFAGVGPRVARAGPSVGIVVSFYEVVKYILHNNF